MNNSYYLALTMAALMFVVGIVVGMLIGINYTIDKLAVSAGKALQYAQPQFILNVNETKLIEGINKSLSGINWTSINTLASKEIK